MSSVLFHTHKLFFFSLQKGMNTLLKALFLLQIKHMPCQDLHELSVSSHMNTYFSFLFRFSLASCALAKINHWSVPGSQTIGIMKCPNSCKLGAYLSLVKHDGSKKQSIVSFVLKYLHELLSDFILKIKEYQWITVRVIGKIRIKFGSWECRSIKHKAFLKLYFKSNCNKNTLTAQYYKSDCWPDLWYNPAQHYKIKTESGL